MGRRVQARLYPAGTHLEPLIFGGPQECQRRAGTENLPGIVGLGQAAEMAMAFVAGDGPARLAALRDRLEKGILARVRDRKHGATGRECRTRRTSGSITWRARRW